MEHPVVNKVTYLICQWWWMIYLFLRVRSLFFLSIAKLVCLTPTLTTTILIVQTHISYSFLWKYRKESEHLLSENAIFLFWGTFDWESNSQLCMKMAFTFMTSMSDMIVHGAEWFANLMRAKSFKFNFRNLDIFTSQKLI